MEIYLLFLILISICTIGIYISVSTKKTYSLLKQILNTLEKSSIEKVKKTPSAPIKKLDNFKQDYSYDELFNTDSEEVFFIQEISLKSKDSVVDLDIQKPKK